MNSSVSFPSICVTIKYLALDYSFATMSVIPFLMFFCVYSILRNNTSRGKRTMVLVYIMSVLLILLLFTLAFFHGEENAQGTGDFIPSPGSVTYHFEERGNIIEVYER